jgi:hypothetical protein
MRENLARVVCATAGLSFVFWFEATWESDSQVIALLLLLSC